MRPSISILASAVGSALLTGACIGLWADASPVAARTRRLTYPQAVANSRLAAEAILSRAGEVSCLRGKLNRALLKLSDSCDDSGQSNALCSLADTAVVVTPMSLAFMDETARQLMALTDESPSDQGLSTSP